MIKKLTLTSVLILTITLNNARVSHAQKQTNQLSEPDQTIEMKEPEEPDKPDKPNELNKPDKPITTHHGDIVLFGKSRTIKAQEVVEGDVVIVGADLTIFGIVKGDAVCVGGKLKVGDSAEIKGDVVSVGGDTEISEKASIKGSSIAVGSDGGVGISGVGFLKHFKHNGSTLIGRAIRLGVKIILLLFMMFIALLLIVFMHNQLNTMEGFLKNRFGHSALLGLALLVAIPVILIILLVTIFGIPLIPLVLIIILAVGLTGLISISSAIGKKLIQTNHPMLQIMVGLLLIYGLCLLGDLIALPGGTLETFGKTITMFGKLIVASCFFIGSGAVVLSKFGMKKSSNSFNTNTGAPPPTP